MQNTLINQYEVKIHEQILKLCHSIELPLHDYYRGCKLFTNYQRVALVILFIRSRKSLRDFVSELVESKWPRWLGLRELPGKSTLHDWIKKWDVAWLREILNSSVAQQKPSVMAIDATGFDSWQRSRHYEQRVEECSHSVDDRPNRCRAALRPDRWVGRVGGNGYEQPLQRRQNV